MSQTAFGKARDAVRVWCQDPADEKKRTTALQALRGVANVGPSDLVPRLIGAVNNKDVRAAEQVLLEIELMKG